MAGESTPRRRELSEFANRLDSLQQDPRGTLSVLRDSLKLEDLDASLELPYSVTLSPATELSAGTLKTINTVSKLVAFFSRYGILSVGLQGEWLAQHETLWFADKPESPLAILALDAREDGPHKDNIWRVVHAANDFLLPARLSPEQARGEAWDVIHSGTGELGTFAQTLDIG